MTYFIVLFPTDFPPRSIRVTRAAYERASREEMATVSDRNEKFKMTEKMSFYNREYDAVYLIAKCTKLPLSGRDFLKTIKPQK
jgi:hypothetical protein